MSDLEKAGTPNHKCGEDCEPYAPLAYQDLEGLEESAHIDTLYEVLDLAREHAAWMVLCLARAGVETIRLTPRSAALTLDLDEEELAEELGRSFTAQTVIDHAIKSQRGDCYVGRALEAAFRMELNGLTTAEE